jgi:hypothetical protein
MTRISKSQRVCGAAAGLVAAALAVAAATEAAGQSQPPAAVAAPPANSAAAPAAPAAAPAAPAASGVADTAPAPPQPPVPASAFPPQPPPPAIKRGFLNDLGNWWENSFSIFGTKIDEARGKLDDINKKSAAAAKNAAAVTREAVKSAAATTEQAVTSAATATKDAATAIVRLPVTSVLEAHERCAAAANGAPDCQAAAINFCRVKGYAKGQPLDIRSSQVCPPQVVLSGREPQEGECRNETVVLRALCQ